MHMHYELTQPGCATSYPRQRYQLKHGGNLTYDLSVKYSNDSCYGFSPYSLLPTKQFAFRTIFYDI